MPDLNPAIQHEVNPEERVNHHRLVATSMLVTFLVIFISQDWWKGIRDYITTKTHGASTVTKPGG